MMERLYAYGPWVVLAILGQFVVQQIYHHIIEKRWPVSDKDWRIKNIRLSLLFSLPSYLSNLFYLVIVWFPVKILLGSHFDNQMVIMGFVAATYIAIAFITDKKKEAYKGRPWWFTPAALVIAFAVELWAGWLVLNGNLLAGWVVSVFSPLAVILVIGGGALLIGLIMWAKSAVENWIENR